MFFKHIDPDYLKDHIEEEAEVLLLGDIEVIDVKITTVVEYESGPQRHNILVFYRLLPQKETKSEVIVK